MATRIENIITKVRDTLADPNGERWSTDRLLRLVNEAQEDIAKQTRLLKGQAEIPMVIDQATYQLPSDAWLLTRATFDDYPIDLVSHDTMDELGRKEVITDNRGNNERYRRYGVNTTYDYQRLVWDTTTGDTIEALVYDNRDLSEIRVYPIPNDSIANSTYTFQNAGYLDDIIYQSDTPFGVWTDAESASAFNEIFGVTTDAQAVNYIITDPNSCNGVELVTDSTFSSVYGILGEIVDTIKDVGFHGDDTMGVTVGTDDYTLDTPFGIVGDMYDPSISLEVFQDIYGIVTGQSESKGVVRVWYIRLPSEVTATTDTLDIPSMFDVAIKHYVVSNAFDDDMDTHFQEKSTKALTQYNREIKLARKVDSTDGTRANQFNTTYRGPFE